MARLVLAATTGLSIVATAVVTADADAGPATAWTAGMDVAFALSGGPTHVDPLPDGVDLDDPTDTRSLYARAGLDRAEIRAEYAEHTGHTDTGHTDTGHTGHAGRAEAAEQASARVAAAPTPPGRPSTAGLGAHVSPSCTGTGSDGRRVQPMYVREATTPSRYTAVLPLLLNEVANVDDVVAVSAARTGGVRRVRWVHDGACRVLLPEVVVPAGALSSFGATIQAVQAQGWSDPERKYLMFADANLICGVGTLYNDTRPSGNLNDSRTAYSRVDAGCWTGSTSIAAHELTHNLGGVLPGAPHQTANGHCWDDHDLMCYDDGSGVPMRTVCSDGAHAQLLDCGNDDYFSTAPVPGSWLASSWNTASSSFLDTTAVDPVLPPPAADPVTAPPARQLARTRVRGGWKARERVVTGVLRTGTGRAVAGAKLTLQRRHAGGPWRAVGRERTDRRGRVAERERPREPVYYRWVFTGGDQLAASVSNGIRVRR